MTTEEKQVLTIKALKFCRKMIDVCLIMDFIPSCREDLTIDDMEELTSSGNITEDDLKLMSLTHSGWGHSAIDEKIHGLINQL